MRDIGKNFLFEEVGELVKILKPAAVKIITRFTGSTHNKITFKFPYLF